MNDEIVSRRPSRRNRSTTHRSLVLAVNSVVSTLLSVLESGLTGSVVVRQGATGLWANRKHERLQL
jgi:hypothetical protein